MALLRSKKVSDFFGTVDSSKLREFNKSKTVPIVTV